MEVGSWRLDIGDWILEVGSWPASSVDPILLGLDSFGRLRTGCQIQAKSGDLAIPLEQF